MPTLARAPQLVEVAGDRDKALGPDVAGVDRVEGQLLGAHDPGDQAGDHAQREAIDPRVEVAGDVLGGVLDGLAQGLAAVGLVHLGQLARDGLPKPEPLLGFVVALLLEPLDLPARAVVEQQLEIAVEALADDPRRDLLNHEVALVVEAKDLRLVGRGPVGKPLREPDGLGQQIADQRALGGRLGHGGLL